MSEVQELQDEEREALISIYEGDAAFKQINPTTYSYKVNFDFTITSLFILGLCSCGCNRRTYIHESLQCKSRKST